MTTAVPLDLNNVRFGFGVHPNVRNPTGDRDMCIMEAVAYMAGEPWTDRPACASPVISHILRVWNDGVGNDDRDRLLPATRWVPRLVGSRGTTEIEQRRTLLAYDWLLRVNVPAWIEDLSPTEAAKLANLPEIVDRKTATKASDTLLRGINGVSRNAGPERTQFHMDTFYRTSATGAVVGLLCGASTLYWQTPYHSLFDVTMPALSLIRIGIRSAPLDRAKEITEKLQNSALDLLDRMLSCDRA